MNYFLKVNKNLITYSLIILLLIPIFGINFFVGLLSNILILLFLIPILLLLIAFVVVNSYKPKISTCSNCGTLNLNLSNTCMSCGSELGYTINKNKLYEKPSESTIEVKAEEVK